MCVWVGGAVSGNHSQIRGAGWEVTILWVSRLDLPEKGFQGPAGQVGVNPSDLVESRLETPFRPSNTLML